MDWRRIIFFSPGNHSSLSRGSQAWKGGRLERFNPSNLLLFGARGFKSYPRRLPSTDLMINWVLGYPFIWFLPRLDYPAAVVQDEGVGKCLPEPARPFKASAVAR